MNERIQELAEQSGLNIPADTEYNGHIYRHALEKFAKLIVRECYEHCKGEMLDKEVADTYELTYNDGVMDCAIGLLQHFGVEE
jgi:hypothetical protein